jgi:hypothetical protein
LSKIPVTGNLSRGDTFDDFLSRRSCFLDDAVQCKEI